MSIKAIHLGENTFVAVQEIFLPVDTDSEKKLRQKQGKENGQLNSPNSQASQLDAVEQEIIQKVAQTAQQTRSGVSQHFNDFVELNFPCISGQLIKRHWPVSRTRLG